MKKKYDFEISWHLWRFDDLDINIQLTEDQMAQIKKVFIPNDTNLSISFEIEIPEPKVEVTPSSFDAAVLAVLNDPELKKKTCYILTDEVKKKLFGDSASKEG